jgi:hypothetical protein
MFLKIIYSIILIMFFISCEKQSESIDIPYFEIELKLNEQAEYKLFTDNESIVIAIWFEKYIDAETDINILPKKYVDRHLCSFLLLFHEVEVTTERIIKIDNLTIPKKRYNLLEDKEIYVTINVYSGRKASNLNILNVSAFIKPLNELNEQRITLTGGLIH